jgi:uncharacterized membrane protein YjgN (DUF898 family)
MNEIPQNIPTTPKIRAAAPTAVSFLGQAGEFFRLLVRGSLLQIPTFGFYRFWLITDIRRHLWANTRIGGEALEYTGTGRELLIGFLIALAILAPVYVGYAILGIVAETVQAFASIPLIVILYLFGQYALYRARRYRATRTVLRGVRFWMTGSAAAYAGRAALWDLLSVVTLGLALPWRMAALERYKMRHTRFGSLQGDFVGTGARFFRRGWPLWLFALLSPALLILAAGSNLPIWGLPYRLISPELSVVIVLAVLVLWAVVYPLFRAIQMRWQIEGIRFGPVAVVSEVRERALFGCYIRLFLALLGYAIVGGLVLGLLFGVLRQPLEGLGSGLPATPGGFAVIGIMVIAYLAFLLGIGVLKRHILDRGLWRLLAGTAALTNIAVLDEVLAVGEPAGSVGEGLADALDVGGF